MGEEKAHETPDGDTETTKTVETKQEGTQQPRPIGWGFSFMRDHSDSKPRKSHCPASC